MPRRPGSKSKPSSGRKKSGWFFAWLFLLFLGAVFWLTWEVFHTREKTPVPPTVPVIQFPAAPVLPPHTPVPVIPMPAPPPVIIPPVIAPTNPPAPAPTRPIEPAKTNTETSVPLAVPGANGFPRVPHDGFETQVALARRAISPGSIDGAMGSQTRAAIAAFQRSEGLAETGTLNAETRAQLTLEAPLLTNYVVTAADLARLQPIGKTWIAKSQQSAMDYETILEEVAEKAHSHPLLVRKLNPGVDWNHVPAGTSLTVPDVQYPAPDDKASFVIIHLSEKYLEAFDAQTNLLAHFPCSIAAKVEKRPVGELHVSVIIPNPNYTFNPEIFVDSPEAQAIGHKLIIPPGPNNPVGVAWIGLDRPGYGMHGTPAPEQVGRTESHGCFRLANWDAEYMVKLTWIGMPVEVID